MSDNRAQLKEWQVLRAHSATIQNQTLNDLFQSDSKRFDHFHIKHDEILLDYSKQMVTQSIIKDLMALANACDLDNWRERMFKGEAINTTENRAVLHTALRTQDKTPILVDGQDIIPTIHNALMRIKTFCENLRQSKKFTHIINIGIGGSDLGSSMVYEALKPYTDRDLHVHFVSNIDSAHLEETLRLVDPEKTLFIITSKTFTTQETMTNAHSAQQWLQTKLKKHDVSGHFVAATQNMDGAQDFGIHPDHIFPIWDWVGGRYSLWSSIGLSFCIALGFENFQKMLDGAYNMDQHFRTSPLEQNIPVMLAMLGIWNRNFLKHPALAIAPYSQYLWRFPAYVQQVDMESNGKSINRQNNQVDYETSPIILGEPGTNAQHAFFQLLHQGTTIVPCDFIIIGRAQNNNSVHHTQLLSNAIAQSKALMEGCHNDNPHKAFAGNRPSNTLILDELTPYTLGMLLALYEHKVFVQGIIWNINSFDQCGVELGKVLADQIITSFDAHKNDTDTDSSTLGLMQHLKNL